MLNTKKRNVEYNNINSKKTFVLVTLGTRGLGLVLDNKTKIHRMSPSFSVLKASLILEEMEWTMRQSSERQLEVSTQDF